MNKNMKQFSFGLDISTTNIGMALFDDNGNLVELNHMQLKVDKNIPPEDRDISKADLFKDYLVNFKNRVKEEYDAKIENVFVEAPLPNTGVNIFTTALLLGFNGMARYVLFEVFGIPPLKISVHNSRKLFLPEFVRQVKRKGEMVNVLSFPKGWKSKEKKEYIRKKVSILEPDVSWNYTRNGTIKDTSYDMSDAFCVSLSSLIVLGIINNDEFLKKNNECLKDLQP